MRIHKKIIVITFALVAVITALFICGFSAYAQETEVEEENFVVANQEESVYGQAILSAEFYEQKNEYEEEIEELQSQIKELKEENTSLKEEKERLISDATFSDSEWSIITKVMVHEAGYQDRQAEKNVCYVIFNRMASDRFPNSPLEVIYQEGQFEGATNISSMAITDELIEVAKEAYYDFTKGEVAQGALFFARGMTQGATYLFKDSVGHIFCK